VRPAQDGGAAATTAASVASPAEDSCDLQPLTLALELQSSSALLSVLTTAARLGCQLTYVHASQRRATLSVLAPRQVAHRLRPCLDELIEVLAVTEVPGDDGPATAREMLR